MTSLTGCSGEAFASILRSLGFEPVKVSKAAFEAANRKAPTEPIEAGACRKRAPERGRRADAAEASRRAAAERGGSFGDDAELAVRTR